MMPQPQVCTTSAPPSAPPVERVLGEIPNFEGRVGDRNQSRKTVLCFQHDPPVPGPVFEAGREGLPGVQGRKPSKILVSQHLLLGHGGARQSKSLAGRAHVQEDVYDPKDLRRKHWWWRALFVKSIAQSLIGTRELSISLAALAPPPRQEPIMSSHDRSNATLAFRQLRLEEIVVRKHIHTACLFILAMVGSGAVLVNLKTVLVPFTMALMLFYSLVPIVDALSVPSEGKTPSKYTVRKPTPEQMSTHVSHSRASTHKRKTYIRTHTHNICKFTCTIWPENTYADRRRGNRPCDRHRPALAGSQAPRRGSYNGGARGGGGGVEMSQRGWGSASDLEYRLSTQHHHTSETHDANNP